MQRNGQSALIGRAPLFCSVALMALLQGGRAEAQPAPQAVAPAPAPAVAEDPEQAVAAGRKKAEDLAGEGKLAEAKAVYEGLYEKYQSPRDLWSLAVLNLRLGEGEEGLKALEKYQERMQGVTKPPGREREEELLKQLLQDAKARREAPGAGAQGTQGTGGAGTGAGVGGRKSAPGPTSLVQPGPGPGPGQQPVVASPPGLRAAKWALGAIGLASVVTGAVLWGLDGRQSCATAPMCATELSTVGPGAALTGLGVGLIGASALMFGLDYRSSRTERLALLTVGGRF